MEDNKNQNILQSFLSYAISNDWVEDINELKHMCQNADFDIISDNVISQKEELHPLIPWEKIDKMKILRVVSRNISISNFVDLSLYKYKIKEIKSAIKFRPQLLDLLRINLNKISDNDAYSLLTIGSEYISERISLKNRVFTAKEIYDIIEANNFCGKIIDCFNLKKLKDLKDYHISNILINTGEKFLHKLNLEKLTAKKWVDILKEQPELLKHCNLEKFKKSDIYNSVELISMFPNMNFGFLIKERDYTFEVSALGWEKLLIANPDEFADICVFGKLNQSNWKRILFFHPELDLIKDFC